MRWESLPREEGDGLVFEGRNLCGMISKGMIS